MNPPSQFVPKGFVYQDDAEKLRLEARNGAIQAEFVFYKASTWTNADRLEPTLLLELQRLAVNQIYRCAGHFRDGAVTLGEGAHKPPEHAEVIPLVDEMLKYINEQWGTAVPTHLAAYAMWRTNWIHPFFGGNGRTARAFSYLVLCLRLGFAPPTEGKNLPEFIEEDRAPYYAALRNADKSWAEHKLDVSEMEELISSLLARQLATIHFRATGRPMPDF